MAYIDREKALLELQKFSFDTSNQYGVGYSDCLMAVEDVLNDLPTADVVEVVRCKDCIHNEYCNQYVLIQGDEAELAYCSYGERTPQKEG